MVGCLFGSMAVKMLLFCESFYLGSARNAILVLRRTVEHVEFEVDRAGVDDIVVGTGRHYDPRSIAYFVSDSVNYHLTIPRFEPEELIDIRMYLEADLLTRL